METNMFKTNVILCPLRPEDREQFILDNQRAFKYGAMEEFGLRDNHFEENGEIISRRTIEEAIDGEKTETYRIISNGETAGGVVLKIDTEKQHGELELLFVLPEIHSMGIGYAAWCAVEKMHPEITIWETVTPYFEKRNIHFYVNRCGFHIVEFFNSHHPDPHDPDRGQDDNKDHAADDPAGMEDGMFRFEKIIKHTK